MQGETRMDYKLCMDMNKNIQNYLFKKDHVPVKKKHRELTLNLLKITFKKRNEL